MAALCAAHAACLMGLTVALIGEHNAYTIWDFGGMQTSGLAAIDAKDVATVTGGWREGIKWIDEAIVGTPDPNPASQKADVSPSPLNQSRMVRRMMDPTRNTGTLPGQNIPGYLTGGIVGGTLIHADNEKKIGSIHTRDGRTFIAKVFAECSYDGDLIYYSGVPYITGMEAAATGANAGLQAYSGWSTDTYSKPADQKGNQYDISALVDPNDPTSALLPDIRRPPALANGDADRALQSMNRRHTGTNAGIAAAYWPLSPPDGYNKMRYEAIGRLYAAATANGVTMDISYVIAVVQLGTGSTGTYDINNAGTLSTDLTNNGLDYANAGLDVAMRKAIIDDLRSFDLGFFYWHLYSGDSRIPAALKAQIAAYAPHVYTHLDPAPGNKPWMPNRPYIREPTFQMVNTFNHNFNDYAMDDGTAPRSLKTIAIGSYVPDIHTKRRLSVGGLIVNQGTRPAATGAYSGGANKNTPLPFEAVVPDKADCANLFSATAFAATKLVWSAERLEAVMCQVGTNMGVAAALAIKHGIAIQDVDYTELRTAIGNLPYAHISKLAQVN